MAGRRWGGSIAVAIGVAAGAGAAQLGFGYGLGIINWTPAPSVPVEAAWVASLAWATWISATSVVAGAICAQRLHRRGNGDEESGGALHRITLGVAAAVGALITVLLVAVPARAAAVPATVSPQQVAAGYAGAGLLVGVLMAIWALQSRAAAINLVATLGWLWLLAVVSVVDGVLSGRGLTSAQLGIWQISADSDRFWIRDYFYWPGALLSMGSALLIGVLAARRTARLPERRVGAAASGAAGPLLVAVAYLLAVPRLAAIGAEQVSAHLIAPYAVIVGIGGSILVAAAAQRAERRAPTPAGVILPRQRTGEPDDLGSADTPDGEATGRIRPTGISGRRATGPADVTAAGTAVSVAEPAPTGRTRTTGPARRGGTTAPGLDRGTSSEDSGGTAAPAGPPAADDSTVAEATATGRPEIGPVADSKSRKPGRRSR